MGPAEAEDWRGMLYYGLDILVECGETHPTEPHVLPPGQASGPYTDWWLAHPHVCDIYHLREVEREFRGGRLPMAIFDEWMSLIGGDYQLADSAICMALWDERLREVRRMKAVPLTNHMIGASVKRCKDCGGHHVQLVKEPKKRKDLRWLNEIFPWSSGGDKAHTNLDLASIAFQACLKGERARINRALACLAPGIANVTATAWCVAALGNEEFERMAHLVKADKACGLDPGSYPKYFKAISVAVRRTGYWVDSAQLTITQISNLAYFELPIGRDINKSNWEEERLKRTCQTRPFYDGLGGDGHLCLLRILTKIGEELVPTRPSQVSWLDFLAKRQEWVSSGSSGGQRLMVEGEKVPLRKQAYFESVPIEIMAGWIDSEPAIKAVASEKYEMGKARAIYGTMPVDYTVMSYVIADLEKRLSRIEGVESGLKSLDEIAAIRRRVLAVGQGTEECSMIDYADFNYQHTLEAQSLVFKVLAARFSHLGYHPDCVKAAKWCEMAMMNQWVRFPGNSDYERSIQGLFSGVRGTNFINTILNVAYFRMARELVGEKLGVHPIDLYSLHQGDDVWISNGSRLWAICLYQWLQQMGMDFQAGKQMFDRGRGEFLRVLYGPNQVHGYVMRAVSTLIIKPMQSQDEITPTGKATALNAQIALLFRRGLSYKACEILWAATIPHALTFQVHGVYSSVPLSLVKRGFADGGLDLGPPGTKASRAMRAPLLPAYQLECKALADTLPRNMSKAWIAQISEKVQSEFKAQEVEDAVHYQNMNSSARPKDIDKALYQYKAKLFKWRKKLVLSSVTRDRQNMLAWLGQQPHAPQMIEDDLHKLVFAHLHCKSGYARHLWIDSLFNAIAHSPFRDIPTARLALGVDSVDAAKRCIQLCVQGELGNLASQVLDELLNNTGRDVTRRILDGIRGIGPAVEAFLHPVELSWACRMATDFAVRKAICLRIIKIEAWDLLLSDCLDSTILYILHDETLTTLSHY